MVTEATSGGQNGGNAEGQVWCIVGGQHQAPAKDHMRANSGVVRKNKRRCVLIADDARSVAARVATLIRDIGGYDVLGPVHDGLEARNEFEALRPDAVILDFAMPHMSGLDVIRAIRLMSLECLIIVLTNQREPSVKERCLAAGADHFLLKSRDFNAISDILVSHFG